MGIADLPTLQEMQATRRALPKGAEPSRLQVKTAKAKDESKEEKRWRAEVWTRDDGHCRWCKRKVVKTLALVPNRGECHHIAGRVVRAIRWDVRNALLLCASCHERITGAVAERFLIVPTKTFTVDGVAYANGSHPVRFKRVA